MYDKPDDLAFNMLSAPDVERVYENNTAETTEHYEQRPALQTNFLNGVKALTTVLSEKGNPPQGKTSSLVVLYTREVVEDEITRSLLSLKQHGTEQLNKYQQNRLADCLVPISDINPAIITLLSTNVHKNKRALTKANYNCTK